MMPPTPPSHWLSSTIAASDELARMLDQTVRMIPHARQYDAQDQVLVSRILSDLGVVRDNIAALAQRHAEGGGDD